jgi:alkylhydroperoxidase family enzyme
VQVVILSDRDKMITDSIVKQDRPSFEPVQDQELDSKRPTLDPIKKPSGFMLRFLYWVAPRQFGKVPTDIKVLATRSPEAMKSFNAVGNFETKGLYLNKDLHYMITMFVSGINGCGFYLDFHRMMEVKENMRLGEFDTLLAYQTSTLFSDNERVALVYVEEAMRSKRVKDETFDSLRKYFTDSEIVEITIFTGFQNFENLLNIPLGIESDGLCAIAQARKK